MRKHNILNISNISLSLVLFFQKQRFIFGTVADTLGCLAKNHFLFCHCCYWMNLDFTQVPISSTYTSREGETFLSNTNPELTREPWWPCSWPQLGLRASELVMATGDGEVYWEERSLRAPLDSQEDGRTQSHPASENCRLWMKSEKMWPSWRENGS